MQDCAGDKTCIIHQRDKSSLATRPNEQFFQYQRRAFENRVKRESNKGNVLSNIFGNSNSHLNVFTGLDQFELIPESKILRDEIMRHVQVYLSSIGQIELNHNDQQLFLWATIHHNCVGHLPHVHAVSIVIEFNIHQIYAFFCICN